MKSNNEKMVQDRKVVNMTNMIQGLEGQGYLYIAFVVEVEMDVIVSCQLYQYLHILLNFVHCCGQ